MRDVIAAIDGSHGMSSKDTHSSPNLSDHELTTNNLNVNNVLRPERKRGILVDVSGNVDHYSALDRFVNPSFAL